MKLWKENKLNQGWELSNEEIIKRFMNSKFKEHETCGIFYLDVRLRYFITDKEGLNSSFDEKEFDELFIELKNVYFKCLKKKE